MAGAKSSRCCYCAALEHLSSMESIPPLFSRDGLKKDDVEEPGVEGGRDQRPVRSEREMVGGV